ncbi:ABC transporter ATP-binding protein [Phaeovulum sp.]|uniref:ABC transporter ATP-binding protein n=1 Tax=Phaeovulum sp. TaxID=2934796 RepID=UPI0039E4437A
MNDQNRQPLLRVRGLEAWYGESQALHGVDFDIYPGETVSFLGRNGVGKTTTLRALLGITSARKGEITLNGRDMMKVPRHRVAACGFGYVPEERGIFATLTVEENLTLPPVVADGGMSIKDIYALFPNLEERRTSQGTKLSGGEQQMLAIARVLRTGAKMILMDEPTEGLAPVIVQRIGEILLDLKKRGLTVLLVEQNFRFAAKVADRFYVMDHGQIVEAFATSELPAHHARLNELLGV